MTRVDLAVGASTNLKVEPLASKKVTRTKRRHQSVVNNIIDGLTVMMSNSTHMHMNNGQFETTAHWTTRRVTNLVYNKLLEQQTNSTNPTCRG